MNAGEMEEAREALQRALKFSGRNDLDAFSLEAAASAARQAARFFESEAKQATEQEELKAEFD